MVISVTDVLGGANPYLDKIKIVRGDLTAQDTNAIVSLIPKSLEYCGSLNESIQEKVQTPLDNFLKQNIPASKDGDLYAVPGFELPCDHIFFCVTPVWRAEFDRHDRHLLNAVRKAMEMASRMSLHSIAFPILGGGHRAYPRAKAARLILQGITDRLDESFTEVRLVARNVKTEGFFQDRLFAMKD